MKTTLIKTISSNIGLDTNILAFNLMEYAIHLKESFGLSLQSINTDNLLTVESNNYEFGFSFYIPFLELETSYNLNLNDLILNFYNKDMDFVRDISDWTDKWFGIKED